MGDFLDDGGSTDAWPVSGGNLPTQARRARSEASRRAAEQERILPPPPGRKGFVLAKTATKTTYPTTAKAFYWCLPVRPEGTESEGATVSYTAGGTDRGFFALNVGTTIPPSGTFLMVRHVDGFPVFQYNG